MHEVLFAYPSLSSIYTLCRFYTAQIFLSNETFQVFLNLL